MPVYFKTAAAEEGKPVTRYSHTRSARLSEDYGCAHDVNNRPTTTIPESNLEGNFGYDEKQALNGAEPINTDNTVLKFSMGGYPYAMRACKLFNRCPTAKMARFAVGNHDQRLELCDEFLPESNEYYFERSPKCFDCVYRFYCTGTLHRPVGVCVQEYLDELDFWEVPDSCVASCCVLQTQVVDEEAPVDNQFEGVYCEDLRRRLWAKFEGDGTRQSNIFIALSNLFVLFSIMALIIGSLQDLQVPVTRIRFDPITNRTTETTKLTIHPVFEYIETVCIVWFTIEYLARLMVAPAKCKFMLTFLNIVDVSAILPFFFDLSLAAAGVDTEQLEDIKGVFLVIRVLRVLRVMRVFKFGRYSAGLRTFALTVVRSARQLAMMVMVMFIGVLFFGTVIYYMEKQDDDEESPSPFPDIPTGFWWCIVTMTTVGYGDVVPKTVLGKIVASVTICCGTLVIALPITVIVDNYMKVSGSSALF